MITNNQIQTAFYDALGNAGLGYEIAYPGVDFTPPDSGEWLEVRFLPNEGVDNGLGYSDSYVPQGIFQVSAATRPGNGVIQIGKVADDVAAVFPKGAGVGPVRVWRHPYQQQFVTMDDRVMIPVTVEYSA